jgi:hypothetical protein
MVCAQPQRPQSTSHRAMPQRPKRSDIHMRKRLNSHRCASRSIEHPKRQVQQTTGRALIMATAGNGARELVDHLMNSNSASRPRMPKVENFALHGPMGVASSRCTMASVHIRALTALRRTRLTSPSCPSAWQHNPGRGSTYRRGNSVQRIGPPLFESRKTMRDDRAGTTHRLQGESSPCGPFVKSASQCAESDRPWRRARRVFRHNWRASLPRRVVPHGNNGGPSQYRAFSQEAERGSGRK